MRKRRPAFSFVRAACLLLALCMLVATRPAPAEAQDFAKGYRLAGTMAVGKDYLAFLEVPQGGQVLVRSGSVVDGVKVLSVTAQEARLAFPAGIVDLLLDGTHRPAPNVASSAVVARDDDVRNRVYNRDVSSEQVSRELATANGRSAAPASNGNMVAAQRIAAVLDLPAGSRVVGVGPTPVTSAQGAIQEIEKAFDSELPIVILDIQTPKGPGRVYLHRDRH